MEKLSALFGNAIFVRATRLFLLHPNLVYSTKTLREKTRSETEELRPTLRDLSRSGVIKKRGAHYVLNSASPFLKPLRDLLVGEMLADINLAKRLRSCGTLKLLIAGGVFLNDEESQTDILVVADKLNQQSLRKVMTSLEADVGYEVRYAAFSPAEFSYRLGMNDKLIRDVLDYPHEKVVNKILH